MLAVIFVNLFVRDLCVGELRYFIFYDSFKEEFGTCLIGIFCLFY